MTRSILVVALLVAVTLALVASSRTEPVMACGSHAERNTQRAELGALRGEQVAFAGYGWDVRDYDGLPTSVGSWDPGLVSIREDGALVLRQARIDGHWASSEVSSIQRGFGYGTYRWTVESTLHDLDPQVVLGLFTYEHDAPGNREIDIEAARWSKPTGDNVHYTLWDRATFTRSWSIDGATNTEHSFTWAPGKVTWCSQDSTGRELASAEVATELEPGAERVHMNFWISGGTAPAQESELVITDFSFSPESAAAMEHPGSHDPTT